MCVRVRHAACITTALGTVNSGRDTTSVQPNGDWHSGSERNDEAESHTRTPQIDKIMLDANAHSLLEMIDTDRRSSSSPSPPTAVSRRRLRHDSSRTAASAAAAAAGRVRRHRCVGRSGVRVPARGTGRRGSSAGRSGTHPSAGTGRRARRHLDLRPRVCARACCSRTGAALFRCRRTADAVAAHGRHGVRRRRAAHAVAGQSPAGGVGVVGARRRARTGTGTGFIACQRCARRTAAGLPVDATVVRAAAAAAGPHAQRVEL